MSDYPVGALIAVKAYDGPIEVRRVTGTVPPEPEPEFESVNADNWLTVATERVDGSDSVFQHVGTPAERGAPVAEDDLLLYDMGYSRAGEWQAHGYARAWSALLAQTVPSYELD